MKWRRNTLLFGAATVVALSVYACSDASSAKTTEPREQTTAAAVAPTADNQAKATQVSQAVNQKTQSSTQAQPALANAPTLQAPSIQVDGVELLTTCPTQPLPKSIQELAIAKEFLALEPGMNRQAVNEQFSTTKAQVMSQGEELIETPEANVEVGWEQWITQPQADDSIREVEVAVLFKDDQIISRSLAYLTEDGSVCGYGSKFATTDTPTANTSTANTSAANKQMSTTQTSGKQTSAS